MDAKMKMFLTRAAGEFGAPDTTLIAELHRAQRLGWVKFWKRPQNSMTSRYKITDLGLKELNNS